MSSSFACFEAALLWPDIAATSWNGWTAVKKKHRSNGLMSISSGLPGVYIIPPNSRNVCPCCRTSDDGYWLGTLRVVDRSKVCDVGHTNTKPLPMAPIWRWHQFATIRLRHRLWHVHSISDDLIAYNIVQ